MTHSFSDTDSIISVTACGREWHLHRPADLETLWDAITDEAFNDDERLPYWVELWPASQALAEWLHKNAERLRGRLCIDLGCGLGLTALVASALGARVVAVDYEKSALMYARRNAVANAVPSPLWLAADWRFPAVRRRSFPFIWGGDIMYERRFVLPVLDFLEYALAPGGVVWVAEPNRNVYDLFRQTLERNGWRSHCVVRDKVPPLHVQKSLVSVTLWEISRE